MSTGPFTVNMAEARKYWGWFVALGVLLVVLGIAALGEPVLITVVSVMVYGILLGISGIAELVTAFGTRTWGGLFLHLISAVVDLALGAILFSEPLRGSIWLTLLLGILFLVGGAMRMAFAGTMQYPNWGWVMLSGAITLLLGGMIMTRWPDDSFFFIGMCVGIVLLLRGWTWIMVGLALSSVPGQPGSSKTV